MMQDEMLQFLKSIQEHPEGTSLREVFGDWLEERGLDRWEAYGYPGVGEFGKGLIYGRGIGLGGMGYGGGGAIDRGLGFGMGSERGRGSGWDSRDGRGHGRGIDPNRGSFNSTVLLSQEGVSHLEIGKGYLILCIQEHAFVGRCVEMVSPVVYRMGSVSKISHTYAGENWHKLAEGNAEARKKATYVHYKSKQTVSLSICAFEWIGNTPQEEEL